jgi:NADH-quinone oxidoreductase subunit E
MSFRRLAEKQPESFEFTPDNKAWAEKEIAKYPPGRQASAVLALLWRAQAQNDYWLPRPAIEKVAAMLDMPDIRVLEVATFYTMFNLAPVGRHYVQLCGTTPCMLSGSDDLKAVCRKRIGEQGHVSADGLFSWTEVECLGACCNAPMVQINDDYYEDLTSENFTKLLDDLAAGRPVKVGSQTGRVSSEPVGGLTSLTTLYGADGKGAASPPPANDVGEPRAQPAPASTTPPAPSPAGAPAGPASAVSPPAPPSAAPVAVAPASPAPSVSPPAPPSAAPLAAVPASPAPSVSPPAFSSAPVAAVPASPAPSVPLQPAAPPPQAPPSPLEGAPEDGAARAPVLEVVVAPPSGSGPTVPALGEAEAHAHAAAEEEHINATLAKLPADANPEQKANAVGARPLALPAPRDHGADDLQRIRGVGPINEKHLHDLGVFHFDQIAAWTRAEIRWVGTYLAFPGRIDREQWVAQAANLGHGGQGPKDGGVHMHLDAKPGA